MRLLRMMICVSLLGFSSSLTAQSLQSSQGRIAVEAVVEDLKNPWGFAFLPEDGLLITERGGRLWHVAADGKRTEVRGVPEAHVQGQGGLLDVVVARNFSQSREVFLSLAVRQKGGSGTAVYRGILSEDGTKLTEAKRIFEMAPGSSGGRHFGSRIVEATDGTLFVTIGERGDRPAAQDVTGHEGTVIRIARTGGAVGDNPFQSQAGAQPEIWSFGHRNPQGATLDAEGRLWVVEHGAKGGDEVNFIKKGANFGWPVISYGAHYSGAKIGVGTEKAGMEQPAFYWDPSIAPSGLMIYSGKLWPEWRGDFFVGSLKFDYVSRLSGAQLREVEKIKGSATKRVRDVREGPNGAIWFLSDDKGTLYRMTPAN
ncbi:PQQ-dependent sugar dehydrogenase [Shimia sp. R9_2]|uniref:PQQ-dependent sugar dehydrogenase n=1 Tax=Shimia sp. R9_2 TaxID=2821112 RepID=UPI001FFE1F61|nr:PQQ-dependent sugar dehydrogenase [Shimia sp. R9_2]